MIIKKNDKIIIVFYIFLIISFASGIFYTSTNFENLPKPDWVIKQLTIIEFEKTLEIDQEKLFLTMSDIENYPKILPKNFVSVNILENNENIIIAEEEIQEKGIRSKFLVKHTLVPYEQHILEILDGDAKGTRISQIYSADGELTTLKTTIDINFKGLLTPFSYLPESNVRHGMNTVITSFYDYAKGYDTLEKNQIDNLYREILLRPADKQGLEYYSKLLETNQININDIRIELSNSKEAKYIIKPSELKKISELENDTIDEINEIYKKILQREVDEQGLEHYGTLLELKKLSIKEIEETLFNSEEALSIRISLPNMKLVDDLHVNMTGKHADWETLYYYVDLIEQKNISSDEIEKLMLENLNEP